MRLWVLGPRKGSSGAVTAMPRGTAGGLLGWDAGPSILHSWKPRSAVWQQLAGLRWGFLNGACGLGRSADQAIPFTESQGSPVRLFREH